MEDDNKTKKSNYYKSVTLINSLQKIPYEKFKFFIKLSKNLTKQKYYYIYFFIILYYDTFLFIKCIITFYISRYINLDIKGSIKQERPYNEYPNQIRWFKKQKYSYSFPSQSIQTICIIYFTYIEYCNSIFIHMYFLFIIALLAITRMYRGLHYLHDILLSIWFAYILYIKN